MKKGCLEKKGNLIITLFFISLLIMSVVSFFLLYNLVNVHDQISMERIEERASSLFSRLSVFPRSSVDDLLFLSSLGEVRLIFQKESSDFSDIEEFHDKNPYYYQIIFLDENKEVLKEFDSNESIVNLEETLLQFNDLQRLEKDAVVISDIYLDDKLQIPTLDYFGPVYFKGNFVGFILLRVDASYFLQDIKREKREGQEFYLIRQNGEYLANENPSKEFSFDEGITFYSDFNLSKKNVLDNSNNFIEKENKVFYFKEISISSGYFSEKINRGDVSWILVSVDEGIEMNFFERYGIYFLGFLFSFCVFLFATIFLKNHGRA